MNETRVRALVPTVIIVVAIGVGAFFGIRYMSRQQGMGTGSGSISQSEFVPDPISEPSEQTTEPATEQKKEIIIGSLDPGRSLSRVSPRGRDDKAEAGSGTDFTGAKTEPDPKLSKTPTDPDTTTKPDPASDDDKLKNALTKATDSEDYTALGTALADIYKRYPQGKKEFAEIESRAYVKATSYLDQEKNVEKARAAAEAVYSKYPFGWRFKYLRVRVLERLGRDAFAAGDLASAEKHALTMLGMEFRPEGANLMADIYLKRIDAALAKGDKAGAQAAYDEIKDYQVSPALRAALDERLGKIKGL